MSRMSLDTAIRLSAEVKGGANITKVQRSLQDLAKGSQTTAREMGTLRSATFQYARANDSTIAGLRNSVTAFRGLQEQAKIGSREFTRYGSEIQKLEGKLRGLDGTAQKAGASLGRNLAAGLAAAGIGRALQGITAQAGKFDAELRKAAAIEGGAGSFEVLRKEIEKVAAAAAGTPSDVAALATALSRAGFSAQGTTQALAGIVRGAEATSVTFEEMGSIAADNLRAFGLQTVETGRVVDALTQTANKSNQTVLDLGESMKYAAPIARNLGLPLEDLAATMGLLANNGIRGSDAGTALRTGLTRLQIAASGSNEELEGLTRGNALLAKAMRSLGAEIIDTKGNLLPLDQVILSLRKNIQGLSAGRRAEIAKALFGDEAGSKFLALLNSSEGQIRQMFAAVRDSGGVAEETQKKMQGFDYSVKVLGGNVEYLTNQIGGMIGMALKPLIDGLNVAIGAAQNLPAPIKAIGAAAAAAGVATLGLVVAIAALKSGLALLGIGSVVTAMQGLTVAAVGAKISMIALNAVALINPWVALAAGIGAATYALAGYQTQSQRTGAGARSGGAIDMASARNQLSAMGQEISLLELQREKAKPGRDRGGIDQQLNRLRSLRNQLSNDVAAGARSEPVAAPVLPPPPGAAAAGGAGAAAAGGGGAGGDNKPKKQSTEDRAEAKVRESQKEQKQAADGLLATESNRLKLLQIADPLQRQIAEARIRELTILDEYNKRIEQVKAPGGDDQARRQTLATLQQAQQNALQANGLELERSITDAREEALKPLNDAVQEYGNRLAYEQEYGGLLAKGINPELAKQYIEIDRIAEASRTSLELQIAKLEAMAAELPIADKLRKSLEDQVKLAREALGLIPAAATEAKGDAKATGEAQSKREKDQAEAEARAERLKELYKGISSTIEEGIIGSMQAGIDSLIDGSKRLDESLKEIASGVLKEISNVLLRFAINSASKALFPKLFADGGVFGAGGVTAFASGGIVDSPTLFKFAQGGAMQNGLMGEAGPEAIMPLRRGADGRLGVDASGMTVPYQASPAASSTGDLDVPYRSASAPGAASELTVPYQSSGAALSVPFLKAGGGDGGAASMPLDNEPIRYESVMIGSVEYVTKAEAEEIGRRSEQRTFRKLQNSPGARRAVGIR
jgi:TP901 family phage tail tape measure protein